MRTGDECGGPQGSGADNAYEQDMQVAAKDGAREALRRTWDALVSPQAMGMNFESTKIACSQVERVAREMGVTL